MCRMDIDYKQIQWSGFVPLDKQGGTIDRCIQSLYLDEFDLINKYSIQRDDCPIENIERITSSDMPSDVSPLFISCIFEGDCAGHADKLSVIFNEKILPLYPSAGLVVFSSSSIPKSLSHYRVHVPNKSLLEFERKVARHLEKLLDEQPLGSCLRPFSKEFSTTRIEVNSIDDITIHYDREFTLSVNLNGVVFEMYCNFKTNSNQIVVFGQAAVNREKTKLPCFFRWKWLDHLPVSGVILNDPTLYLSKGLNGGWFVGTTGRDYVHECNSIIHKLCEITKSYQPPVFFGSSAGGFSSLALASAYPRAKAIIDIPQVNLETYHVRSEIDKLSMAAFSVNDVTLIPDNLKYRIDISKRFEHEKRIPEIIYLHNIKDTAHISQLNSFLQNWSRVAHMLPSSEVGALRVITYDRWHLIKGGHVPLSKNESIFHIKSMLNK